MTVIADVMARLSIHHETRYDYDRPVGFGPHRLLIRPRDSHAMRIVSASLLTSPPGDVRWTYDAVGNCVCWFTPRGAATALTITSRLLIDRFAAPLSPLTIDDPHSVSPVAYGREDRILLAPFIAPATDDDKRLLRWLRGQVSRRDEPALDFLLRLNSLIHDQFEYQPRSEAGVQTPGETLARGVGACRDLAWLMIEALRRLGYAAAFATGYIYSPSVAAVRGAGATHAWCRVFLPDLGWTEFDPTNGLAESPDLIRVAVSRTPVEARPISGTVLGDPGEARLTVGVDVQLVNAPAAAMGAL